MIDGQIFTHSLVVLGHETVYLLPINQTLDARKVYLGSISSIRGRLAVVFMVIPEVPLDATECQNSGGSIL